MYGYICSNCGAEISANDDYCAHCGAKIVSLSEKRFCSRCGNKLDDETGFCVNCGSLKADPPVSAGVYPYTSVPGEGLSGTFAGSRPENFMESPTEIIGDKSAERFVENPRDIFIETPMERFGERPRERFTENPADRYAERPEGRYDDGSYERYDDRPGAGKDAKRNEKAGNKAADKKADRKKSRGDGEKTGLAARFKALPMPAKIAIISGIAIIIILIAFSVATLVNNALSLAPVPASSPSPPPPSEDPVESPPASIQSVSLIHNGLPVTDITIQVEESAMLRVIIKPDGIEEIIEWTNNNQDTVEVNYTDPDGSVITVTGLKRGSARLTVKVGEIETVCIIRVEEELPPEAESIAITSNGLPFTQAELLTGESIDLRITVEPEGVADEIILSSTAAGIIEITPNTDDKTDIKITGVGKGTTTLQVSVGRILVECVFEVLETWDEAYAELLRNPENYQKDISDWNDIRGSFNEDYISRFTLRDLDSNEPPELLLVFEAQAGYANSFILVYTYQQSALSFIGRLDGAGAWSGFFTSKNPDHPGIFSQGGRMGHLFTNYAEMRSGRLEIIDVAYEEEHSDSGEYEQRITIYNENLFKEFESTVLLEAHEINEANIQRYVLNR